MPLPTPHPDAISGHCSKPTQATDTARGENAHRAQHRPAPAPRGFPSPAERRSSRQVPRPLGGNLPCERRRRAGLGRRRMALPEREQHRAESPSSHALAARVPQQTKPDFQFSCSVSSSGVTPSLSSCLSPSAGCLRSEAVPQAEGAHAHPRSRRSNAKEGHRQVTLTCQYSKKSA